MKKPVYSPEVELLREALEFYADPENWNRTGYPDEGPISKAEDDYGDRARKAISGVR